MPLVSPVTVWLTVVVPPEVDSVVAMSLYVPEESCSSCQPVMPASAGLVQLSVNWALPGVTVGVGALAGAIVMKYGCGLPVSLLTALALSPSRSVAVWM